VSDPRPRAPRRRLRHEARVTLLALTAASPALIVALVLLWFGAYPARVRFTLTLAMVLAWGVSVTALRERVVRPLQTLSNMLAALREGDYSIRARGADTSSPLGLAFHEVNALADALRRQRLDAMEATGLLRRVMEEIDVAIFAFDDRGRLRLLNGRAEALIGLPPERALGADAAALGLSAALAGDTPRLVELGLPGAPGRWEVRRGTYRWEGRPHHLVVLSDLTRSLREEERVAWQRLVRVLSHEINNSLAPIQSIAATLKTRIDRGDHGPDAVREMTEGLGVIEARSEALGRFIHAYARLARLPAPRPQPLDVATWARRAAALETRMSVAVEGGPEATLAADGDQIEALLANLVRNAADAALESGGGARVRWSVAGGWLGLEVEDDGPGLPDTSNLFVPFFTTKPNGTGIGLTLCRQIAEAHGGSVVLANRPGVPGCVATLRLPLGGPRA
jgi:nitrogen fixation/metabolism regulation signal transduction histidine kinase